PTDSSVGGKSGGGGRGGFVGRVSSFGRNSFGRVESNSRTNWGMYSTMRSTNNIGFDGGRRGRDGVEELASFSNFSRPGQDRAVSSASSLSSFLGPSSRRSSTATSLSRGTSSRAGATTRTSVSGVRSLHLACSTEQEALVWTRWIAEAAVWHEAATEACTRLAATTAAAAAMAAAVAAGGDGVVFPPPPPVTGPGTGETTRPRRPRSETSSLRILAAAAAALNAEGVGKRVLSAASTPTRRGARGATDGGVSEILNEGTVVSYRSKYTEALAALAVASDGPTRG
ncbi:unnamed protein product, partial [Sphacelaria rigidula]